MSDTPAVRVRGLAVVARGRPLLVDTAFQIERGELCLLVGGSGTGKSITLGLLSGLRGSTPELEVRGEVEVLGQTLDPARPPKAGVRGAGVVFQDFALFDDLNTHGNVAFGRDHGLRADEQDLPAKLLEEFGLPQDARTAHLSGGMKQRLALARALAFGPELLFYDEPTSGLDPAMSRRVAGILRRAHDQHAMTSIIVTHDLEALASIADRILFLDPEARTIREVPKEAVHETLSTLERLPTPAEGAEAPKRSVLGRSVDLFARVGRTVRAGVRSLFALLPRPPRWVWAGRFFWHYLRLTTLGSALPFLALAGLIGGFVTTYFLFGLLPFRGFTEPVLAEEFVGSLGFALYRVLVPGLVTLLFAARAGAAIAADSGNRVLTRQIDALRSHGVDPARYLLSGVLWASLIGMPLLLLAADLCARAAALAVFLAEHPGHGVVAFEEEFQRLLGGSSVLWPGGAGWVFGKILACAFGTAAIAWHVGMRRKLSGSEVAEGVTAAIIRATIFVLVVHMIFAFFEFHPDA